MFKYFLKRELQEKYLSNISGISWLFIQPIIILFLYSIVFDHIFKQRIPEAQEIGFSVYLAIGLWPWIAFSESFFKAITCITEKKSLIGKIKLNTIEIVLASVTGTFLLNIIGYILVLALLYIVGTNYNFSNLILLLFPLITIFILCLSLSIIFSAVHVYIRDIQNIFSTLLTLWFFSTPIIYSKSIIPASYRHYLEFNPLYYPITFMHDALLTKNVLPWKELSSVFTFVLILLFLAIKLFKRLEPNFDEFV